MPKVKLIKVPKALRGLDRDKKEVVAAACLLLGVKEKDIEAMLKKVGTKRKPSINIIARYEERIAELEVTLKTETITREYLNEKAILENRISELTSAVDELSSGLAPLKSLVGELSEPWLKCATYFKGNKHASSASTGFDRERTLRLAKVVENTISDTPDEN